MRRLLLALACVAAAGVDLPPEVGRYAAALRAFQSGGDAGPALEAVYEHGDRAREALLVARDPGARSPLETLDATSFAAVERELRGFVLLRDEIVAVSADHEFFVALARESGEPADVAFFAALVETLEPGGWPRYLELGIDHGGCARLGSPLFVSLYRTWTGFRTRFPDHYRERARRQLAALEEALLHGGACEARPEALVGLRRFVAAFPDAPPSAGVRERIAAFERKEQELRSRGE